MADTAFTLSAKAPPLPNLIYAGMGKAGSTLLYKLFNQHPDFHVSPVAKEVKFFSRHESHAKGLDHYRSYFRDYQGQRWIGDLSPGYWTDRRVAGRMRQALGPDMRIILTMRRYTDFLISRYLHMLRQKHHPVGLIEHIEQTMFRPVGEHMADYVDQFGAENVLIMQYELDFSRTAPAYENKIYDFLGLPQTSYLHLLTDPEVNTGYLPRYVRSGAEGYRETRDGIDYAVPPDMLVFCDGRAWKRQVVAAPSRADLAQADRDEAVWTLQFPETLYTQIQERFALPVADQIERRLGINMDHWREPRVKTVRYQPAPLSDHFIADPELREARLGASGRAAWR